MLPQLASFDEPQFLISSHSLVEMEPLAFDNLIWLTWVISSPSLSAPISSGVSSPDGVQGKELKRRSFPCPAPEKQPLRCFVLAHLHGSAKE